MSVTRTTRDTWAELACVASIAVPETEEATTDRTGFGGWIVTVYNNDFNTWDEVIHILMSATSCPYEEAHMETWEIHHQGSSVVHQACEEECSKVAAVIATIGIRVEASES
jgi:ATP-dependent Clp protease adapter protein ClpS